MTTKQIGKLESNKTSGIAPTALLTAYAKSFSASIPFSKDVGELIGAERASEMLLFNVDDKATVIAGINIRYRSLDNTLRMLLKQDLNGKGVLELGAGMTPRGLNLAIDYSIRYVGIDVSEYFNLMPNVYEKIITKNEIKLRGKYYFVNADAQNTAKVINATGLLHSGKPVLIINEGFLPWFSKDQLRSIIIPNIKEVLGGNPDSKWVTPDIAINGRARQKFHGDRADEIDKSVKQTTGTATKDNQFETESEADEFYTGEGFNIRKYRPLSEYLDSELLNLRRQGLDTKTAESRADAILDMDTTYVLEIK